MKKILAVLIVLFVVASCLFVAGTVAAKDKQGGHGGKKVVSDELSDMEDFSTGGIEGKQKVKRAEAEGIPLQSPEEFGMTQLTDDDVYSIHPMFSPDGRKIAYMNRSWEKEYRSEIWVMNADGSNKYNVTDADVQCGHLEGWSPDGTKLLYRSQDPDWDWDPWDWPPPPFVPPPVNDLWLANADGSGVTQITFEVNGTCFGGWASINGVATDFSPDGSKIAFKKCYWEYDEGWWGWRQPDLWVMDANGANQVQLTNTSNHSEQYPRWSPDGSKILYKRCNWDPETYEWSPSDLWVINADGSNPHVVVAGAGPTAFSWSSDGEWIVWSSSRFGREDLDLDNSDNSDNSDIYRVRADGTGLAMLTSGDTECQQDALVFGAGCRDVIMYRDGGYGDALWVMSLHGALATQVSPSWVGEKAYDHSPNGEWLVFQTCDTPDGHTVIYTAKNPLYCPTEVPTLMPIGIVALIGLLSVIVAISIIRKRKG